MEGASGSLDQFFIGTALLQGPKWHKKEIVA